VSVSDDRILDSGGKRLINVVVIAVAALPLLLRVPVTRSKVSQQYIVLSKGIDLMIWDIYRGY
jgi:hypothetical protein